MNAWATVWVCVALTALVFVVDSALALRAGKKVSTCASAGKSGRRR